MWGCTALFLITFLHCFAECQMKIQLLLKTENVSSLSSAPVAYAITNGDQRIEGCFVSFLWNKDHHLCSSFSSSSHIRMNSLHTQNKTIEKTGTVSPQAIWKIHPTISRIYLRTLFTLFSKPTSNGCLPATPSNCSSWTLTQTYTALLFQCSHRISRVGRDPQGSWNPTGSTHNRTKLKACCVWEHCLNASWTPTALFHAHHLWRRPCP